MLLAFLLAGCSSAPERSPVASCPATPVSSFADLHGLAVNPERPNELLAATHHGLFRAVNDSGWARIGDSQDDLMGFSSHPTNGSVFFSSGHPGGSFGNLGFRHSVDGGCTWQRLGMEGADFHAMTVSPADANVAWGFYAGKLYRSTDGGAHWDVMASNPPGLLAVAGDPASTDTLYGAAGNQGLLRSTDGGATWNRVLADSTAGVAVDPHNGTTLYAGGQGMLQRSTDAGATWMRLPVNAPADAVFGYIAVSPGDSRVLYAGTYQTSIFKSSDGGATWTAIKPASR
jgi:photosystem II stability/assembly factor-like uncharacterized protein